MSRIGLIGKLGERKDFAPGQYAPWPTDLGGVFAGFGSAWQRKHFQACCGGTTRNQFGFSGAGTTAGTIASADDTDGTWHSFTTSGVSGNVSSVTTATADVMRRQWRGFRTCQFKTSSDLSSIRLLIGLTTTSLGSSSTPTSNCALLAYDTAASHTGWVFRTADGSNGTTSAQIAPIATSTPYWLSLDLNDPNRINVWLGTDPAAMSLVHSATANLPTTTTGTYLWCSVTTLASATRQILWSHFTAIHK